MDKEQRKALILDAIGQASMAWSETPTGVFQSQKASEIADKLEGDLFPEAGEAAYAGNRSDEAAGQESGDKA